MKYNKCPFPNNCLLKIFIFKKTKFKPGMVSYTRSAWSTEQVLEQFVASSRDQFLHELQTTQRNPASKLKNLK